MSFYHPNVLWLLAVAIVWGYWQWNRKGHPLVVPYDHSQQKDVKWLHWMANVVHTLPAVLLALAILLLAGPRKPAPPTEERVMNNVVICLDVSGSMSMKFGNSTRYDAAVASTRSFCQHRPGDAFGLTVFGVEYLNLFPPTKDTQVLDYSLNLLTKLRDLPWFGGTMIGKALLGCQQRLMKVEEGDKAIILLTDGMSSDFEGGKDREVAEMLARTNIRVFCVMVGQDGMAGMNSMDILSSTTGGKVFQADDPRTLENVFQEIDKLQKTRFKQVTADWVYASGPIIKAMLATIGVWLLGMLGIRFTPW